MAAIFILPNGGSFIGRHMPAFLIEYANIIGANTSWNFFSPNPAQTMYLQYKVRFEDEQGNETKESVEGFLPPEKEKVVIDSSRRRFLYAMRFLLLDPNRLETLFEPWLCREFPGASSISVRSVQENLPTLDHALANLETPVVELKEEVKSASSDFRCGSTPNEVTF